MSAKSVRLYVGFGGSGAKSLLAFTKLLASHEEWGDDSETRFAFVLVDTDKRDLDRYSEEIKATCRRIGKDPIVRVIQTSQRVPMFQTYVAHRLRSAGHDERIQEHWWYRNTGEPGELEPFTAETLIASPEDGAGQCPMVSAFLAWNNLDRIGNEITSVVEELARRITLATGEQEAPILCSFIAGLAGGTGRGCWHMLAFKVREALHRAGKSTLPVGYFFDATVFRDIMAANPEVATKMRVNSLTGFSELHAWMRNEWHRPDPYDFWLPNIDSPRDDAADLIRVHRIVGDERGNPLRGVAGQSPVSIAYVIFGGGKAGDPGAADHYYKVLANAMYSQMVDDIASESINRAISFGGIGSASVVIPINEIKGYVRMHVSQFLPAWYAKAGDTQRLAQWSEWLTSGFEASDPFGYTPNAEGNLYERIVASAMASQSQRLKRLGESMDKPTKDYKVTAEECKRLDGWVGSNNGRAAIEKNATQLLVSLLFGVQASKNTPGAGGLLRELGILDQLTQKEFAAVFGGPACDTVNCVTAAFRRVILADRLTRKNPNGSMDSIDIQGFGAKAHLANLIATRLRNLAKTVPDAAPDQAGAKSAMDELGAARGGVWSRGIDANEAGLIMSAARRRIQFKCMGAARPIIERNLNEAADLLERLARDLGTVVGLLRGQAEDSESASAATRERLFWNRRDYDAICDHRADRLYSGGLLAEQSLQPVEDDASLDRALVEEMESGSNDRFQTSQEDLLRTVKHWLDGDAPGASDKDRRQQMKRQLSQGIGRLCDELVLKRQFYFDHFGFFQTIRGLVVDWGREFRRRAGNEQDTQRMKAAFRVLFGCDFPFDADGPVLEDGAELDSRTIKVCECLAVELANRCDVLFHQRLHPGDLILGDQASVILPAQDRFHDDFVAGCADHARGTRFPTPGFFKPVRTHGRRLRGNPFAMVAFASAPFDWNSKHGAGLNRVASLDYHKDPEITKWLQACEHPDGLSVFTRDPEVLKHADRSYGLGYCSPIFVRNELLRTLRWRPWMQHGEAVVNQRWSFIFDVIAYAMLDEPRTGDVGPALQRVTDKEGWPLPLISLKTTPAADDDQAKKWQFTRSPIRRSFKVRSADHPAAKAGDGYTSIKKLQEAFSGGDPNPLVDAIAEEAELFLKEVLSAHPEAVNADGALTAMFRELSAELQVAKDAETGPLQVEYRQLYQQLMDRVKQLAEMGAHGLLSHYERRGRV